MSASFAAQFYACYRGIKSPESQLKFLLGNGLGLWPWAGILINKIVIPPSSMEVVLLGSILKTLCQPGSFFWRIWPEGVSSLIEMLNVKNVLWTNQAFSLISSMSLQGLNAVTQHFLSYGSEILSVCLFIWVWAHAFLLQGLIRSLIFQLLGLWPFSLQAMVNITFFSLPSKSLQWCMQKL